MTAPLPVDPEALQAWLTDHRDEMLATLRALAGIETPSRDPSTHGALFDRLEEELAAVGLDSARHPGERTAGLLHAWPRGREEDRPHQLLIGHEDTVWPLGTLEDMPVEEEDGRLRGPGVYDMKAGLTQVIYALRALRDLGVDLPVTPHVIVNSDEEIGSRESRAFIEARAADADRAFVMEPSLGREGALKTARKGVGRFQVTVRGKASHAGLAPEAGVSAILELSHVIQQLFALNDPQAGVTVNVGTIDGGMGANVVAPESKAVVDVRVPTHEDAERLTAEITGIRATTPGAVVEITGGFPRPPMEANERNQALWRLAHDLGAAMGLSLEQGRAGGASDGNFTSQTTPTLDGLGAVGDGAHAAHEFVFTGPLVERTALLAQLIAAPPLRDRT